MCQEKNSVITELVRVKVTNNTIKWYVDKGYHVPTEKVQLYAKGTNGQRIKNGIELRIKNNTEIFVKPQDLPPSNKSKVECICSKCGAQFTIKWSDWYKKKTDMCRYCSSNAPKVFCHTYWVKKLITDNPDSKCDISGETDKRFLELHHLTSVKDVIATSPEEYVILSANYHRAFHKYISTTKRCTPELYFEFKRQELHYVPSIETT